MPQSVAFFDLDKTILEGNSGMLWALSEISTGHIPLKNLFWANYYNTLYKLSWVDMSKVFDFAMSFYRGKSEEDLRARHTQWFAQEITPRIRPKARRALDEHRKLGHKIVLLSNCSHLEAEMTQSALDLDDSISNVFNVIDGFYDGSYRKPLCFGGGKVHWALNYCDSQGMNLKDAYFYTDSFTDLPLLKKVGHPRIVTPDRRLKRFAEQQSWPVLDWSFRPSK